MRNEDFYVGWMQTAPASFARFMKKYLLVLLVLICGTSILLATNQKKFSTANFEFGKMTTLKGVFSFLPVPHLIIEYSNEPLFIPLVGYGKHGADGIMKELGEERQVSLEKKEIELNGTLLYGDGKIIMQVDKNDKPLVKVWDGAKPVSKEKDLGITTLSGEVIDPKCYFGVMKPGEGKVHKDCAIRCISGGIPPVLAITNGKGEKSYVLLIGANGERINDKVKDFVAVPSQVTGRLLQYDNWMVMRVSTMKSEIATVSTASNSASCGPNCCIRI
jgi:hypothetical protein